MATVYSAWSMRQTDTAWGGSTPVLPPNFSAYAASPVILQVYDNDTTSTPVAGTAEHTVTITKGVFDECGIVLIGDSLQAVTSAWTELNGAGSNSTYLNITTGNTDLYIDRFEVWRISADAQTLRGTTEALWTGTVQCTAGNKNLTDSITANNTGLANDKFAIYYGFQNNAAHSASAIGVTFNQLDSYGYNGHATHSEAVILRGWSLLEGWGTEPTYDRIAAKPGTDPLSTGWSNINGGIFNNIVEANGSAPTPRATTNVTYNHTIKLLKWQGS